MIRADKVLVEYFSKLNMKDWSFRTSEKVFNAKAKKSITFPPDVINDNQFIDSVLLLDIYDTQDVDKLGECFDNFKRGELQSVVLNGSEYFIRVEIESVDYTDYDTINKLFMYEINSKIQIIKGEKND